MGKVFKIFGFFILLLIGLSYLYSISILLAGIASVIVLIYMIIDACN